MKPFGYPMKCYGFHNTGSVLDLPRTAGKPLRFRMQRPRNAHSYFVHVDLKPKPRTKFPWEQED